jgi:Leucine-rich repeat (LRR) protein
VVRVRVDVLGSGREQQGLVSYARLVVGQFATARELSLECGRLKARRYFVEDCMAALQEYIDSLPRETTRLHSIDISRNRPDLIVDDPCEFLSLSHLENLRDIDWRGAPYVSVLRDIPPSVTSMSVTNMKLDELGRLPEGLQELFCARNHLRSLPELPAGLMHITCAHNQLVSLPQLHASLSSINCVHNQLRSLPALPAGLTHITCAHNQLRSLPELPAGLTYITCEHNQLVSLPELPARIVHLDCSRNNLEALPALPARLETLDCSRNNLVSLPALPARLETLDCSRNNLEALPALPAGPKMLDCHMNRLSVLPALPASLLVLNCSENRLTDFQLPPGSRLARLNFSGNASPIQRRGLPARLLVWDGDNVADPTARWDWDRIWNWEEMLDDETIEADPGEAPQEIPRVGRRPTEVDPNHVHQEMKKFDYDQILQFFASRGVPGLLPAAKEAEQTLSGMVGEAPAGDRPEMFRQLNLLMENRLNNLAFGDTPTTSGVFLMSLRFAARQPLEFRVAYVEQFLHDCTTAYDVPNEVGRISCAAGVLERGYTSLRGAAIACQTQGKCADEDYSFFLREDPDVVVRSAAQQWVESRRVTGASPSPRGTSVAQREADLRAHLAQQFTPAPAPGSRQQAAIDAYVASLVEGAHPMLGDEALGYEGGRRRTRRAGRGRRTGESRRGGRGNRVRRRTGGTRRGARRTARA